MTQQSETSAEHLKSLGSEKTRYVYNHPQPNLLERFDAPFSSSTDNVIEISAPEFTSLCPKTGQPDFATIVISYVPNAHCVESKSLKLYLGSFRQHGEFHEACVARIHNDLMQLLAPKFLHVQGQFSPRGGIKFWPTVRWSE